MTGLQGHGGPVSSPRDLQLQDLRGQPGMIQSLRKEIRARCATRERLGFLSPCMCGHLTRSPATLPIKEMPTSGLWEVQAVPEW